MRVLLVSLCVAGAIGAVGAVHAQDMVQSAPTPLVLPSSRLLGSSEALTVVQSGTQVRITLDADVLFDFDKATLTPKANDALQKAAALLPRGERRIDIGGHTDGKGNDGYNMRLSRLRAEAVKRWFVDHAQLPPQQMVAAGFGKRQPVAPNTKPDGSDDPDGGQRNRRVEIRFDKS